MATLNIQLEIPSSSIFDIEELKRQLSDYASRFIASQSVTTSRPERAIAERKRRPLSPTVKSLLCVAKGVSGVHIDEKSFKEEYLIDKYNESIR